MKAWIDDAHAYHRRDQQHDTAGWTPEDRCPICGDANIEYDTCMTCDHYAKPFPVAEFSTWWDTQSDAVIARTWPR